MQPNAAFVATLGGQPQIVTLALDRLLAQSVPIVEVIVVHLARSTPRYQDALQVLAEEFSSGAYAGKIRFTPIPVAYGIETVEELANPRALDVTQNNFERLFPELKQSGLEIHLCPTGGRRMLGMLALIAAQMSFDRLDRVWHLYSSDEIRAMTNRGALLHIPIDHGGATLLRLEIQPWAHMLAGQQAGTERAIRERETGEIERRRCLDVQGRLTQAQSQVIRAVAHGRTPQEIAADQCVTLATVNAHLTPIYQECRSAWNLAPNTRLDYRWLREHFARFFDVV